MQEMSRRTRQMSSAIRDEVVKIIQREISDPRVTQVGMITVSGIKLSPDHKNAMIFVSFMGKEEKSLDVQNALAGLTAATGFFHRLLLKRLQTKNVPQLIFRYDPLFDKADIVQKALTEAAEKEAALAAVKNEEES